MKLKAGPWDGAQPRGFVFSVLRKYGLVIVDVGDGDYMFDDGDGLVIVLHIPQPVSSEIIELLYRQFGHMGFHITDLIRKH